MSSPCQRHVISSPEAILTGELCSWCIWGRRHSGACTGWHWVPCQQTAPEQRASRWGETAQERSGSRGTGVPQDLLLPSCGAEQSPQCARSRTARPRCLRVSLAAGPVPVLQLHMSRAAPRRNQEANTSSVCCWAKPSSHLFPPRQLEFFYKVQLCFTSQQIKIFLPGLFCLTSASMVFLRRISILFAVVLLLQTFSRTPITVPRMKRSLSVTGPARPAGQQQHQDWKAQPQPPTTPYNLASQGQVLGMALWESPF